MIESVFAGGLLIAAFGLLYLVLAAIRARFRNTGVLKSTKTPLMVTAIGLFVAFSPAIFTRIVPIDLGPYEDTVDGERHLTLTGWDRKDYSVIASRPDTVVLQMANEDVSDETMKHLEGLKKLRELDLSFTKITDKGLSVLLNLPELERLRLQDVPITDNGFRTYVMPHPKLKQLVLQGTQVSEELKQQWLSENPERMAM
ncbi:MAG: hypothetical protein JNL58_15870 [Planctomyces sp.]|nr:hypothetical protein [Planctomyces sp.]